MHYKEAGDPTTLAQPPTSGAQRRARIVSQSAVASSTDRPTTLFLDPLPEAWPSKWSQTHAKLAALSAPKTTGQLRVGAGKS